MSHESAERSRGVLYTLPSAYSDTLRTLEFDEFFRDYTGTCFSVRTLDGWSWTSSHSRVPQFVATFQASEALDAVIDDASEATLGRIFLQGNVELDGNILVLLSVAQYTIRHSDGLSTGLIQTVTRLSHHFSRKLLPGHRNSARQNWQYTPCPLDLPVSFFEPWLGSFLGHTCGSFSTDTDDHDFECAHRKALERACRRLEIEWRDRLLEVGCGWGSLLTHAAEHHGASVQGITSTERQSAEAEERIHRRLLGKQCSVQCRDLRISPLNSREFDKIAHLGIFEQVCTLDLQDYLRYLRNLLVPGGLLLMHRLTAFPDAGACMTSLPCDFLADGISRELHVAEKTGFDLISAENLSSEYQETVRIWIANLLNARQDTIPRVFSTGYRAWMLYLIEIATCLNSGEAQVHGILLRRRP
jgi:cyclopropane-fatty-acyl-phospholipid synthase